VFRMVDDEALGGGLRAQFDWMARPAQPQVSLQDPGVFAADEFVPVPVGIETAQAFEIVLAGQIESNRMPMQTTPSVVEPKTLACRKGFSPRISIQQGSLTARLCIIPSRT